MRASATPLLVLLVLAACAPAGAPPARPGPADLDPRLAALLKSPSRAAEIACDLSDRVGPRLSGSPGFSRAVDWALAALKEAGVAEVHSEPVSVPHWERGAAQATLLGDGIEEALAITALGGSVATPPGGLEGEILEVPTVEALAAMPPDVAKGKIVYFDQAMQGGREAFESYGKTVSIRGTGASEAARHGALAAVIRSLATSEARFPHTGAMRYAEGVAKIPAGALAVPDAELVTRLLHRGIRLRLRLLLETHDLGEAPGANVLGEVKGREKPEEIVLLGAHLDAWDLGRGAIDDGAGVGLVLDVAHALAASPPRRTVRVVLFANEENGLHGAKGYAAAHAEELARHHAALEMDAGTGTVLRLEWTAANGAKPLFERMAAALSPLGVSDSGLQEGAGGADTIALREAGVPTLELLQDGTHYFDYHHSADDTCDKLDPKALAQARDAALIATWLLAEEPGLLDRSPKAAAH